MFITWYKSQSCQISATVEIKSSKNILLRKESLNRDDQQFHQYQQNKQSPSTLTHWPKAKDLDIWR
jgi:hypothetical protein